MENRKRAYLFLRFPSKETTRKTIRKTAREMQQYASREYQIVKQVVKIGNTRFACDAADPYLLADIVAEDVDVFLVRCFQALGSYDDLYEFYEKLEDRNILCLSMVENIDLPSYLHLQNASRGMICYE